MTRTEVIAVTPGCAAYMFDFGTVTIKFVYKICFNIIGCDYYGFTPLGEHYEYRALVHAVQL